MSILPGVKIIHKRLMMIWFWIIKKIDDVLYKKANNELSDSNKNIFQEAKKLLDLRVEIYKKFVLEEKSLKFEKSIGKTVKWKNQKDNFSETPEQKKFNNFLAQIKEEQKNIDINWFKNVFNYKTPDEILKYLPSLKTTDNYNQATSLIEENCTDFKDEVEIMSEGDKKNKGVKILNIIENILNFTLKERKIGQGLKILTPNQMLSRLPISLAQLKAENNSEKLKTEIRKLLYSLYRSRKLTKQLYKSLVDII